jgi:deoxyribonuclease-4
LKTIAEGLDQLLRDTAGYAVSPVLENTAGQGAHVGSDFTDLKVILDSLSDPDRVGVCFDTQHAFAAGWDLRTEEGYESCFETVERSVGLGALVAFHLNDSKRDLGDRVDRHENIGKGFLGEVPFARLVNDPRFADLPGVAETPADKSNKKQPYAAEIRLLKSLRTEG